MTKSRDLANLADDNLGNLTVDASGNLDVSGIVTADGLDLGSTTDASTVSTTPSDYQIQLGSANSTTGDIGRNISFETNGVVTAAINSYDAGTSSSTGLAFFTGTASTLRRFFDIKSQGDISFYDNTGVTQGFFWDASTQRLGLGTTTPLSLMHLKQTTGNAILKINSDSGERRIDFGDATDDDGGRIKYNSADEFQIYTGGTEKVRISASGLVGIGTTSPSGGVQLDVRGTGVLQLVNTDTVQLLASNGGSILKNVSNNPLLFGTNNTERMRIDSSGKVTITKTAVAGSQTASITGSTTLDFGTYQNFILTLTGNVTLANPTTEQVGQSGFITFIQTGGYTVSLGTDYETAGGAGITLSASGTDVVPYIVAASGRILLGAPQLAFA